MPSGLTRTVQEWAKRERLAVVDFPIAFGMKTHLEEAVPGVVLLAAAGTGEITAPGRAPAIVVFGDGEGGSATAGNEEHFRRLLFGIAHIRSDTQCTI